MLKTVFFLMHQISSTLPFQMRMTDLMPQIIGDVAQLARALDWQSRGRGFESLLLHFFEEAF